MGHRNDFHREALVEHLDRREWTAEDKEHFLHMVDHSALISSMSALAILEYQQATDERIEAEKQHDEVFAPVYTLDVGQPANPFIQERFEEIR